MELESKRHAVFVINSLVGGGAERAMVNIIGGLKHQLSDFSVTLVLLDRLPKVHAVPSFVTVRELDCRGSMATSVLRLLSVLRGLKPDFVVSFLSRANCANVLASRVLGYPAVISERVHTSSHFGTGLAARLHHGLTRIFYKRAALVLAVSDGVKSDLVRSFGVPAARIEVLNNPIDTSKLARLAAEPCPFAPPDDYIVAVGRLVPNKNMAMLIEGFARSAYRGRLVILGEGPEREALAGLAERLDVADRVLMPGYVANPYPVVGSARFLVSSSNAEGFPNGIVEAMALGRAVVATDCQSGPAEILGSPMPATRDVVMAPHGILIPVNDADRLAEAIDRMLVDETRDGYAARGAHRVLDYAPEVISSRLWGLLSGVMTRRPAARPDEDALSEVRSRA